MVKHGKGNVGTHISGSSTNTGFITAVHKPSALLRALSSQIGGPGLSQNLKEHTPGIPCPTCAHSALEQEARKGSQRPPRRLLLEPWGRCEVLLQPRDAALVPLLAEKLGSGDVRRSGEELTGTLILQAKERQSD